jgi:pyridoxine 5-phosphate synthase
MRLYVNVDHAATIRQARRTDEPDPVRAAILAELGGADGITVHLREDRRHIQDDDLIRLAASVRTILNVELATAPDVVERVADLRPPQITLVPERREEVTTEGGLDLGSEGNRRALGRVVERFLGLGVRVSLFIDPERAALEHARELGVHAVELHTGEYALASGEGRGRELARLARAAAEGGELGLAVHAGHGLTYENVLPVAALPGVEELNIGHSIMARALLVGMQEAVRDMADRVRSAPTRVRAPGSWLPPAGF